MHSVCFDVICVPKAIANRRDIYGREARTYRDCTQHSPQGNVAAWVNIIDWIAMRV